ncbi:Uncharacterized protein ChrSV_1069 [Chromobacterium vaccinii]|nr:Uncharacterized protein ChrSW_1069 [Chromobacterium vaccinii]QND88527.1 Uncharacterized protein ChrSV_1069 [Chromobacterium vaccinii]
MSLFLLRFPIRSMMSHGFHQCLCMLMKVMRGADEDVFPDW